MQAPRRRRRPEDARLEIEEAARELLAEQPFHQVTVSAIMGRTTLSRKSFYVYFRDRYQLLTALVGPLRAELDEANALWLTGDADPAGRGRAALHAVAQILSDRGTLVRALADAARYDEHAARLWREFNEPVIERVAAAIRAEAPDLGDPERVARALVGMNLYCLFEQVVGNPRADVDGVVDALLTVWMRTVYPARWLLPPWQ